MKEKKGERENFVFCLFTVSEHYVATVTWATEESLMVQWLKRLQNHAILQTYKRDGSAWAPEKVTGML